VKIVLKLAMVLLVFSLGVIMAGCENPRYDDGYNNSYYYDNPRYVRVEVYNYTSYRVDAYVGDAFVGDISSGYYDSFSKDLYDGERLRLRFVFQNQYGEIVTMSKSFDDDYSEYHVNLYNNRMEYY